jgi:hypothetical protein
MPCAALFGRTKHERDDLEFPGNGELPFHAAELAAKTNCAVSIMKIGFPRR